MQVAWPFRRGQNPSSLYCVVLYDSMLNPERECLERLDRRKFVWVIRRLHNG